MSIWATQVVHDAVTRGLTQHPGAGAASSAFVEVSTLGATKAALVRKTAAGAWQIEQLYTADHYTPGTVGVVVKGLW